jgi:hypothetical protein
MSANSISRSVTPKAGVNGLAAAASEGAPHLANPQPSASLDPYPLPASTIPTTDAENISVGSSLAKAKKRKQKNNRSKLS